MNNIQSVDELLTKHITDFNVRDSGGMDDTKNCLLCNKEAKADLLKLIEGAMPETLVIETYIARNRVIVADNSVDYKEGYNQCKIDTRAALKQLFGGDEK